MARYKLKAAKNAPATRKTVRGRGRPVVHDEEWTKVTVVLFNRQIVALHRLSADVRAATGRMLNRTQIIRALIDALVRSKMDVTRTASESDLARVLLKQFSG